MSDYPEHDKLAALRINPDDPWSGRNQLIGEFIEWLQGTGRVIARWHRPCYGCDTLNEADAVVCAECGKGRRLGEARLLTTHDQINALVGEFFAIDPKKLSEEKDAMLRAIRAANDDRHAVHDKR